MGDCSSCSGNQSARGGSKKGLRQLLCTRRLHHRVSPWIVAYPLQSTCCGQPSFNRLVPLRSVLPQQKCTSVHTRAGTEYGTEPKQLSLHLTVPQVPGKAALGKKRKAKVGGPKRRDQPHSRSHRINRPATKAAKWATCGVNGVQESQFTLSRCHVVPHGGAVKGKAEERRGRQRRRLRPAGLARWQESPYPSMTDMQPPSKKEKPL